MLPLLPLLGVVLPLELLVALLDVGDKKVPTVALRKSAYCSSLMKATIESDLLRRLEVEEEVFPPNSTAAWNQAPSTVHISGPPESP